MDNNKKKQIFFSLSNEEYFKYNKENIIKITNILNKDRLVIVNGMKNNGKINFIKELIHETKIKNNYFYFNKSDDIENNINSNLDLLKILNDYVQLYKIPKIVILQNISKINGIKEFISYLYKNQYKVILIGNSIKIGGIKELEIKNRPIITNENINSNLKYGFLLDIKQIDNIYIKEKILKLLSNDIFLNSIFKDFSVKSIELYIFTIIYLSKNNIFYSLRELYKQLDSINKISLKTTIDYIDFSLQSKIIKRSYKYDIKTKKEITSKAKYYFSDNGIRNSLVDYKLNKYILLENMIFNILDYNDFIIYSGINGKFEFSFYGIKEKEKIFIHISRQETKEELKKEINKLNKIKDEGKKYLLVKNIKELAIKKIQYNNVLIIEINEFIINFKQK